MNFILNGEEGKPLPAEEFLPPFVREVWWVEIL